MERDRYYDDRRDRGWNDDRSRRRRSPSFEQEINPIERELRQSPSEESKKVVERKEMSVEKDEVVIEEKETPKKDVDSTEKKKTKKSKHKKHKKSKHESKEEKLLRKEQSGRTQGDEADASNKQETPAIVEEQSPEEPTKDTDRADSIDRDVCGPALPPHLLKPQPTPEESADDPEEEHFGPKLPPSVIGESSQQSDNEKPRILGPILPSEIDLDALSQQKHQDMSDISESEDDDLIGPVPEGQTKTEAHLELERRAIEMKLAKLSENDAKANLEPVREEWMIELPEVRAVGSLNLGPRQFRKNDRPDLSDRSSWTETPKDREGNSSKRETAEQVMVTKQKEADATFRAKRDAEQEEAARKHKKKHKRDQSLLEIHQKKLKKEKKKEKEKEVCWIICKIAGNILIQFSLHFQKAEGKPARRPFSRDDDLKVNRFDQAQKNAILKKAQLLDTRFGSGEAKFL